MTTTQRTKTAVAAAAQQLIAGTTKHLTATPSLLVQGRALSVAQVVERLQTLVSLRNDVDAAKAQTKAKLAAESAAMPPLRAFYDAYVTFVKGAFAGMPDTLADFGIRPKTRAPLSVEAKTAAAAKRNATRAARHTMGNKQKKSVKGAVVGVTVTQVTSSPSGGVPRGATASGSAATTPAPAAASPPAAVASPAR